MVGPNVTLVAYTSFIDVAAAKASGYVPHSFPLEELYDRMDAYWDDSETPEEGFEELNRRIEDLEKGLPSGVDELAEFAGRNCYQSWQRPNPATATNKGYNGNIIKQKHFSVFEHASATFFVDGVSTALLGQLSRHRHLSFSVLSKRYVDESESKSVIHPGLEGENELIQDVQMHHDISVTVYENIVQSLLNLGYERKRAREIARGVLPQATETRIVVTGNMRAWREVIEKRTGEGADEEIKAFAKKVLVLLKELAPNTFQDLEV